MYGTLAVAGLSLVGSKLRENQLAKEGLAIKQQEELLAKKKELELLPETQAKERKELEERQTTETAAAKEKA